MASLFLVVVLGERIPRWVYYCLYMLHFGTIGWIAVYLVAGNEQDDTNRQQETTLQQLRTLSMPADEELVHTISR